LKPYTKKKGQAGFLCSVHDIVFSCTGEIMNYPMALILLLLSFTGFAESGEDRPLLERNGSYPLNSVHYFDKISLYPDGRVVFSERGYQPIWEQSTIAQLPSFAIDEIKHILAFLVAGDLGPEASCPEDLTDVSYNAVNSRNESLVFAAKQFCISDQGEIVGSRMRYLLGFDTSYSLVSMLDGLLSLAHVLKDGNKRLTQRE
jgi:hypothetical protein